MCRVREIVNGANWRSVMIFNRDNFASVKHAMTFLISVFSYEGIVTERALRSLNEIRDVYGIRALSVDERNRNVRVEYDASRLKESDIGFMLRNAGIRLQESGIRAA
jgi:hypothetical protein